jgi:hypothetical protein
MKKSIILSLIAIFVAVGVVSAQTAVKCVKSTEKTATCCKDKAAEKCCKAKVGAEKGKCEGKCEKKCEGKCASKCAKEKAACASKCTKEKAACASKCAKDTAKVAGKACCPKATKACSSEKKMEPKTDKK